MIPMAIMSMKFLWHLQRKTFHAEKAKRIWFRFHFYIDLRTLGGLALGVLALMMGHMVRAKDV